VRPGDEPAAAAAEPRHVGQRLARFFRVLPILKFFEQRQAFERNQGSEISAPAMQDNALAAVGDTVDRLGEILTRLAGGKMSGRIGLVRFVHLALLYNPRGRSVFCRQA
jgi:hypothetical protein